MDWTYCWIGGLVPVLAEEVHHRFGHAGVLEHDSGPGGPCHYRVKQGDQAGATVEDRQFHRQDGESTHFHTLALVAIETFSQMIANSARHQHLAVNTAAASLPH